MVFTMRWEDDGPVSAQVVDLRLPAAIALPPAPPEIMSRSDRQV